MSTTYDLCCPELKVKVWVGQSSAITDFYLYSDDEQLELLSKFFMLTEGKRLVFVSEHCEDEEILDCDYMR
ncbi:hypothetical protein D3C85_716520 [compost metagenome]